jgi:predicted metalloprotease with PDZ domain
MSCLSKKQDTCDNCIFVNISKDLNVVISIPTINQDSAKFLFPRTIPGIYHKLSVVTLENFKALDSLGNKLRFSYSNDSTIYIYNVSKLKKISYKITPSYYTTKNILADGVIKTNDLLVCNNQKIIGYFQEQINNKYIINIQTEDSLKCISHFKFDDSTREIKFDNYHRLIDSPLIFSSHIDTISELINGVKVGFSTIAPLKSINSKYILEIIKPTIKAVFNEIDFIKPSNYNFIFIFNDSINKKITTTALEHNNSSIYTYFSEPNLSNKNDSLLFCKKLKEYVSHELFHLFIPLNYNDNQLTDFNFQKLELSEHLWLYEGFVEYYSQYILLKNDIITDSTFINNIADKRMKYKMRQSAQFPLDLANFSKYIYDNNKLSLFYSLGFINALNLDILIRQESNMKFNLFSVLQKEFSQKKSFNSDSLFINLNKYVANDKVLEFANKYIYGNQYPDYEYYLSMIGLSYSKVEKEQGFYFPVKIIKTTDNNTVIVEFSKTFSVIKNKKMEILKINGQNMNSQVFSLIYRKYFENPSKFNLTIIESDSIENSLIIEPLKIKIPDAPYFDIFKMKNNMTIKQRKMNNEYFNNNIL